MVDKYLEDLGDDQPVVPVSRSRGALRILHATDAISAEARCPCVD